MPQSKERHAEWMRERRVHKEGAQTEGAQPKGSQYPSILYALTDPVKRGKLEKIYESLKTFRQEKNVYLGYPGLGGVPFDVVGEYLEATR